MSTDVTLTQTAYQAGRCKGHNVVPVASNGIRKGKGSTRVIQEPILQTIFQS